VHRIHPPPSLHGVPARLVVAEGGEDVTIKVSDEGGGIPRSGLARIWTYLYSTARQRVAVEALQVGSRVYVCMPGP
jgi:signal transduction histidine kinase